MKRIPASSPAICACILAGAALIAHAGPLDPPAGPVAPTMKTLQQVEPRTPITTVPFTILTPGSYYLTGNLTGVAGQNGVLVSAAGVTIDLNGFALQGVPGSLTGINVSGGGPRGLIVKNGFVRSWGQYGIASQLAPGARVEGVTVEDCGLHGILVAKHTTVVNCTMQNNGGHGLTSIERGSVISGCTAAGNADAGFYVAGGCTFIRCMARANERGFDAYDGTTLVECTAVDNSGLWGIYLSQSRADRCGASGNAGDGFRLSVTGAAARGCASDRNTGDGFELGSGGLVEGCYAAGNGGGSAIPAGIHATGSDNRIEGNTVIDNGRGLDVQTAGNFIARNTAAGNNTNYLIVGAQTIGPIVTGPGTVTSNAWSNFED